MTKQENKDNRHRPNVPPLRFRGFTAPWQRKPLGDIVSYSSTGVRAEDITEDGSYDLYDANGVIGKVSQVASKEPYISIIKDGSGVGRVRKLPQDTCCLGTMGCIIPQESNNIDFIFGHLETKDFREHIISGAIPHLYFRDYSKDELAIPSLAEQEKIGTFLRALNELIVAREEELEKLRQMKAALLDAMFPNDAPVERERERESN